MLDKVTKAHTQDWKEKITISIDLQSQTKLCKGQETHKERCQRLTTV